MNLENVFLFELCHKLIFMGHQSDVLADWQVCMQLSKQPVTMGKGVL